MFIGEAPGRKGADRTRVPFSGDQSGANFDRYLNSINLTREEIFITSAALCNPRAESGANRRPTQKELANCSTFLRRAIELIDPRVIVTLGSVALEALKRIQYHELNLKESAATAGERTPAGWRAVLEADYRFIMSFWDCPKPTIARVNGAAYVVWEQGGDVHAARLQDSAWTLVPQAIDVDPALQAGTGNLKPKVGVSAEGYAVVTCVVTCRRIR